MIQQILVFLLGAWAVWTLFRKLQGEFSSSKKNCGGSCGKCRMDFAQEKKKDQ